MKINIKDLNECPVLSDYERELLRRVYVDGETQSAVAKSLNKDPSTICIQLKKALVKFESWMQSKTKESKAGEGKDSDAEIFRLFNKDLPPNKVIEKVGKPERVFKLWEMYRQFLEDDYCRARIKLSEYGFVASGDSDFPLCEQLDNLIGEREMFVEEEEEVRGILGEHDVKGGLVFGGYGSISDGVKRLGDKLFQRQSVVVDLNQENEDLSLRLDMTRKELEDTKQALKDARQEILKLKRLESYEELSEERKEELRIEIDLAQRFLQNLNQKINELQIQKVSLEEEIDVTKQIEREAARNIQKLVYEYLAESDFSEVLRLYSNALKHKTYGKISVH